MNDYETMERDNWTTKSFMFYLFSFCSYQTMWRHNTHMSPSTCRYWNRMQYRHRFDVLSIALLMTTQLSAVAYSGRAPDCLVRTDTRRRPAQVLAQPCHMESPWITLCFFVKKCGFPVDLWWNHHFLQPENPGKPMETWGFSPPCSRGEHGACSFEVLVMHISRGICLMQRLELGMTTSTVIKHGLTNFSPWTNKALM